MEFNKRFLTEQDQKDIIRYYILHKENNTFVVIKDRNVWEPIYGNPGDVTEIMDVVTEYEINQELTVEEVSEFIVMELGAGSGFVKMCDLDIDILQLILDTGKINRIPLIYQSVAEHLLQEKRNESIEGLL